MKAQEQREQLFMEMITVDKMNRFRDMLSVGKKCKVYVKDSDDGERGISYKLRKIIVAKKYPNFCLDDKGKCWQYIDLMMGERM